MFLTQPATFEKTAAGRRLSGSPEAWGNEILSELYRDNAYLGSFQVDLQTQAEDQERGYMYGYFLVTARQPVPNQVAGTGQVVRPEMETQEQEAAQGGPPAIRIPIIVQDRKLWPLDVFIDPGGKFWPLEETRVMEQMSTPENLEAVKTQVQPTVLSNEYVNPPSYGGQGGGTVVSKSAAVDGTALDKLAHCIYPQDRVSFLKSLENPEMAYALQNNETFKSAVGKIYHAKLASAADLLATERAGRLADAVCFEKVAGGVDVHSALGRAYEIDTIHVPLQDMHVLPDGIPERLGVERTVLVSTPIARDEYIPDFQPITKSAHCAVVDSQGDITHGAVISNALELDGSPARHQLFLETPRYQHGEQEKLAGVELGEATQEHLHWDGDGEIVPGATGVFVKLAEDGSILGTTTPVCIGQERFVGSDGRTVYQASSGLWAGGLCKISHVGKPAMVGGIAYVPEDWPFAVVGNLFGFQESTQLSKTAASSPANDIVVVSNGGTFSFRGGCGVDRLPYECKEGVKEAHALVMLGCLGLGHARAKLKLATAQRQRAATLQGGRVLTSYKQKVAEARETATRWVQNLPDLRVDLTKIAAQLTDEASVDAVLALNFITPDNVNNFLQNLETFEEGASHLAELLIATRLGLPDIPESAVARAMTGLDAAIRGLKQLQARTQQVMDQPQG